MPAIGLGQAHLEFKRYLAHRELDVRPGTLLDSLRELLTDAGDCLRQSDFRQHATCASSLDVHGNMSIVRQARSVPPSW